MSIQDHRILILDFGSQYTQLIARCIRELGVYCEIHSFCVDIAIIEHFKPCGVILSGGPESVTHALTPRVPNIVFERNNPVLGICYGMQSMALQLGGKVSSSIKREFGYAEAVLPQHSRLLSEVSDRLNDQGEPLLEVWMSHGDQVTQLPERFVTIASTVDCPIAGMADESNKQYGLQFHPEVSHTRQGKCILKNFVMDICGCRSYWTAHHIIQEKVQSIQKKVAHEQVLLALSGGVDSLVTALLLHKALGQQLTCVFVDTGLLRYQESERVQHVFAKHIGIPLICIEAKALFYQALKGEKDPEKKRKKIGRQFIDIFEAQAAKMPQLVWLAQGTIYSDVIESAATHTGQGCVIKSHHNVAGLPSNIRLKLLEPLRELFKDEVYKIGKMLGLPDELLMQHPFPGPGLAVRILGEVRLEYLEILRLADAILIEELHRAELYNKVSQAFAVFLPIKSVCVLGDARHYDYVICLRIVETVDFMTACWARLPYDFLATVSNRIMNEVPGISRVSYDISNKPPATIEWE